MATEFNLQNLSLTELHKFTLYNGIIKYGIAAKDEKGWYIIMPSHQQSEENKYRIIPAQIENIQTKAESLFASQPDSGPTIYGSPQFKTLIILGAGASHNYSFSKDIINPPLAKDLFDDQYKSLKAQHPGVESLSPQLFQAKDIEQYFQIQWDKIIATHNPVLLNKIVDVQFYLHALFEKVSSNIDIGRNNYVSFFQTLNDYLIQLGDNQKALIVSFNYDTILEQSLARALYSPFNSLDDYIDVNNRRMLVFKPHGSWNWVKFFKPEFIDSLNLEKNRSYIMNKLAFERKITLATIQRNLEDEPLILPSAYSKYYFPHLLIPYKKKDEFVMPKTHSILLEQLIRQVNKIIVIGWKGTEEKFKNLLKRTLSNKKVSVIYATLKDKSIENELKEVLPSASFSEFDPSGDSKNTFTELNEYLQEFPNSVFYP